MLFGLGCLAVAAVWLALDPGMLLRPHRNAQTVAWTHVFVLGFGLSIVTGALYQIAPVALETVLFSDRLARVHSWLHLAGVPILTAMFYVWDLKQAGHAGSLVFLGMLLLAINLGCTLGRAPRPGVVGAFVASALLWLFLTMVAGLAMAANAFWPFLPQRGGDWLAAHAHLGVGGIFINLIVGLSFRLAPMFLLGAMQSAARAWLAWVFLNAGVAWLFAAIAFGPPAFGAGAGVAASAGLALGLWEIAAIVAARRRRRIDWGMRMFLAAVALTIPMAGAGFVAAFSPPDAPVRTAYALVALLGVVGFAIIGMLHKILPFLVWFTVYSPLAGRAPTPSLADMISPALQRSVGLAYPAALVPLAGGVLASNQGLATLGAWLWAGAVAVFLCNAAMVLRHLLRPAPATTAVSESLRAP